MWPEEIELQSDLSASAWVLPRLLPSVIWGSHGTPVASVVPTGYPAYLRLFHPAGRNEPDPDTTWRDVEVTWREVADWSGRRYHPLMQFTALSAPTPATTGPAPFTQEPWKGHLLPGRCRTLFSDLAGWTTTPGTCWLGIWEGRGCFGYPRSMSFTRPDDGEVRRMAKQLTELSKSVRRAPRFAHPGRHHLLAKGPSMDICELGRPPLGISPSLTWPDDRSCCVGSEIDFDSTLVAASVECAEALLSDDRLEIMMVQPDDRLDIGGDVLNTPPVEHGPVHGRP